MSYIVWDITVQSVGKSTDVSVEQVASSFMFIEYGKQETSAKQVASRGWRPHFLPKRQITSNGLRGFISQKTKPMIIELLQRSDVLRGIFRYFGDVYLWAKPRY
jgi:hypothetical protein